MLLELATGAVLGGLALYGVKKVAAARATAAGPSSAGSSRRAGTSSGGGGGAAARLRAAMQSDLAERAALEGAWLTYAEQGAKWGGEAFGPIGMAIGAALGAFAGEAQRILSGRPDSPRVVMERAAKRALRAQTGEEPSPGEVAALIHAAVLAEVWFVCGWDVQGGLYLRIPRPGAAIGHGSGARAWREFIAGWLYDPVRVWATAGQHGELREAREPVPVEEQLGFGGRQPRRANQMPVRERWYLPPAGVYLVQPVADAPDVTKLGAPFASGAPGLTAVPVGELEVSWARPSAVPGEVAEAHCFALARAWT